MTKEEVEAGLGKVMGLIDEAKFDMLRVLRVGIGCDVEGRILRLQILFNVIPTVLGAVCHPGVSSLLVQNTSFTGMRQYRNPTHEEVTLPRFNSYVIWVLTMPGLDYIVRFSSMLLNDNIYFLIVRNDTPKRH